VHVGSDYGSTWLTLVSELTKEDNIIVPMGSTLENDLCPTIDSSPLHCMVCSMILVKSLSLGIHFQGTWSWMSAEVVMAGPGQPVIHQSVHELESCFYVLIGIFVLLDEPYKPKSDKELAQCFNKYFNTFEPSILKTITIQADLTWEPFILKHISPYFEPATKLLTHLRDAIISPLYVNCDGKFCHRTPFFHEKFIIAIIDTLSELNANAWVPCSCPGRDRLVDQAACGGGGFKLEGDDDAIVAEPKVEFSDVEAGDLPADSVDGLCQVRVYSSRGSGQVRMKSRRRSRAGGWTRN